MSNPELEAIMDKIQKLMNLKEGATSVGSYAEAENAASRIQDILMKYNLDIEQVQGHSIRKRAEFFNGWVDLSQKFDKRESFWVPKLYGAIGQNNLCRIGIFQDGISIIGRKEQTELVLYIADQMIAKIRIAEKYAWNGYEGEEKRGTFRRGFFEGAVHGINNRLREEKNDNSNPYAVMIVSREQELADFVNYGTVDKTEIELVKARRKQEYEDMLETIEAQRIEKMSPEDRKEWEKINKPRYKKERERKGPKGLSSNDGYFAGRSAGEKMYINKGVNQKQSKANIS